MNEINQQKLYNDFPKIYADFRGDPRYTCMAWGFECPDEWFNMLYELSERIQKHCDENETVTQVVAQQVKEKYNGLRFYFYGGDDTKNGTDEYISDMVDKYEELSYKIPIEGRASYNFKDMIH